MSPTARKIWPDAKALKTEGGALRRLRDALPSDKRGIESRAIRVADGWLAVAFLSADVTYHAGLLVRVGICVTNDREAWTKILSEI